MYLFHNSACKEPTVLTKWRCYALSSDADRVTWILILSESYLLDICLPQRSCQSNDPPGSVLTVSMEVWPYCTGTRNVQMITTSVFIRTPTFHLDSVSPFGFPHVVLPLFFSSLSPGPWITRSAMRTMRSLRACCWKNNILIWSDPGFHFQMTFNRL